MDTVFISGLRIETLIGVFDWEREIKQAVFFDIEMAHDNVPAAQTDNIALALNYKAVSDAVIDHVEQAQCELIETLAEQVAALLQAQFGISWLMLTLRKPGALRTADDVGVRITRGKK